MAKNYTETLLKVESASNGHLDSLYQVLTLITKTYTEALLKGGSAHDGYLTAYSDPYLNS